MSSERKSWIMELRELLATPPPRRLGPKDLRQASVLVPLYVDGGELWTILTKRTDTLPTHRSQIAFPGGGRELKEDFWDAALREAQEEIGLEPRTILKLGELDEGETPAGFRVIPCVGAVPYPYKAEPNEAEIAEVFSLPLSAFANPRLVEDRTITVNGDEREIRIYHIGNRQIWGLTARILQNLLERLGIEGREEE